MQGLSYFVDTQLKIDYLNSLLQVGFDTLDFGSFVSAKAIPQMQDTADVLAGLDWEKHPHTKLLAIVANLRGAAQAVEFAGITYIGFPLAISETFQKRNTNKTIAEALEEVKAMQDLCLQYQKNLVVYISMGFGNPYGDPFHPDIVLDFVAKLDSIGIRIIPLADTVGTAEPELIHTIFKELIPAYPHIEFGAHFHALPQQRLPKLQAAYQAGCRRFDAALKGFGGCPMAKDDLVGNIATETLVEFLQTIQNLPPQLNLSALGASLRWADKVFSPHSSTLV
jgi:hydroxymethylglutaryl-CoA lyase